MNIYLFEALPRRSNFYIDFSGLLNDYRLFLIIFSPGVYQIANAGTLVAPQCACLIFLKDSLLSFEVLATGLQVLQSSGLPARCGPAPAWVCPAPWEHSHSASFPSLLGLHSLLILKYFKHLRSKIFMLANLVTVNEHNREIVITTIIYQFY